MRTSMLPIAAFVLLTAIHSARGADAEAKKRLPAPLDKIAIQFNDAEKFEIVEITLGQVGDPGGDGVNFVFKCNADMTANDLLRFAKRNSEIRFIRKAGDADLVVRTFMVFFPRDTQWLLNAVLQGGIEVPRNGAIECYFYLEREGADGLLRKAPTKAVFAGGGR